MNVNLLNKVIDVFDKYRNAEDGPEAYKELGALIFNFSPSESEHLFKLVDNTINDVNLVDDKSIQDTLIQKLRDFAERGFP